MDQTSQSREPDPEDNGTICEFIEQADSETKSWFLALPTNAQIEFLNDPDKYPKILGRKP